MIPAKFFKKVRLLILKNRLDELERAHFSIDKTYLYNRALTLKARIHRLKHQYKQSKK